MRGQLQMTLLLYIQLYEKESAFSCNLFCSDCLFAILLIMYRIGKIYRAKAQLPKRRNLARGRKERDRQDLHRCKSPHVGDFAGY